MANFRLLLGISAVLLTLRLANADMEGEPSFLPSNQDVQDYGYFVNPPLWMEEAQGYIGRPKRFFPKIHLPLALRSSFDYSYNSLGHVPSSIDSSSNSKAEVTAPARPSFRVNTQADNVQDESSVGQNGAGRIHTNEPVHLRFG
ncbi:hypothetical protein RvY_08142 [Ramazzottius varieornatus]|uniref:Uncharacterized protein n=1 Tax=Ramazzottius varieornatus TaxID=947166 RepID=A0A1D1VCZ9_RAMVA|nr:hypothetical protein RvY_08142 [Ramazzottius varieornatus]